MSTFKYVGLTAPGQLGYVEAPVPSPGEKEVLVKVEYAAVVPFDLYNMDLEFFVSDYPYRLGLSGAGTIEKAGLNVDDLKVGDRVTFAAFAFPNKALLDYTVQPRSLVSKIPDSLPLEKAVTYPDNFATAFYTLFSQIGLPIPTEYPSKSSPPKCAAPILVYGGGATSGQYMIQLLALAGYKNIITAASKHHEDYLRSLGATHVVDYRSPSFVEEILAAAGGKPEIIIDVIALSDTFRDIHTKLITPGGSIAFLGPFKTREVLEEVKGWFAEDVSLIVVQTLFFQKDERLANTLLPVILSKFLEDGLIAPNPTRVFEEGDLLARVQGAIELVRSNKANGQKIVVKLT
ncbi:chaperonin 10-like protein [Ephemerocybe angulata]|uniref:Chaperonin 10-like protein n=1 Tax=Ephemerocybe angulata TaxID=980116 RepID=A0A8H6IH34_9AGAR|nr:chaperonin 10-like protein [Tulosesus angulatus]